MAKKPIIWDSVTIIDKNGKTEVTSSDLAECNVDDTEVEDCIAGGFTFTITFWADKTKEVFSKALKYAIWYRN